MGEHTTVREAWNDLDLHYKAAMYFAAAFDQRQDLAFRAVNDPESVTLSFFPRRFLGDLLLFSLHDGMMSDGVVFGMSETDFWQLYNKVDEILGKAQDETSAENLREQERQHQLASKEFHRSERLRAIIEVSGCGILRATDLKAMNVGEDEDIYATLVDQKFFPSHETDV